MSTTTNTHLDDLRKKIDNVKFGMLTTTGPDQMLSSRPMTAQQIDAHGQLWFFTSDRHAFTRHLQTHPQVNVAFSDPDNNLYVSASGHAELVKDRNKIDELWNPMVGAWFPGGKEDPELALICVDLAAAEYWDSSSSTMTQLYAIAKGIFTGKRPTDIGEHVEVKL